MLVPWSQNSSLQSDEQYISVVYKPLSPWYFVRAAQRDFVELPQSQGMGHTVHKTRRGPSRLLGDCFPSWAPALSFSRKGSAVSTDGPEMLHWRFLLQPLPTSLQSQFKNNPIMTLLLCSTHFTDTRHVSTLCWALLYAESSCFKYAMFCSVLNLNFCWFICLCKSHNHK